MKTKISRIGKKSLSVVIALMMIVSTMLVGMVTTNAATSVTLYFASATTVTFKAIGYNGSDKTVTLQKVDGETYNGMQVYKTTEFDDSYYYLHIQYGNEARQDNKINNSYFSNYDGKIYDEKTGTWSTYSGGSGETETYYYVVGVLPDGTTNWDSTSNLMKKQSDGKYTWSYTNTSGSEKSYGVKVKSSKGTYYPDGYKTEKKGTLNNGYTLTVTFDPSNNSVTADPTESVTTYTVKAGTCKGGFVTVGESTSSVNVQSGTKIPVVATAAENYVFDSWNAVGGVEFDDPNSATTMATITDNVTITATFRSTSAPSTDYYYSYWNGSMSLYEPMKYDAEKSLYKITTNSTLLMDSKKFKITTSMADGTANDKNGTCLNWRNPKPTLTTSENSGVTVGYNDDFANCCISGTTKTEFIVTYDPNATGSSSNGTIKVWSVADYEGTTAHSITVTTPTNGKVECAKTSANKDEEVSFDVTPNTGYEIGTVTITGVETPIPSVSGNTSTYTFTMPDSDVTINATFKAVATTETYDVVKGTAQAAISMTETSPGSGIFVSSGTINDGDFFTIRKTYGSEVTYAANNNNYYFVDSSNKATVSSWSTTYSDNTNIYINNLKSEQYVCYDSNNDQIYLQSTGSGGGTLSDRYFFISTKEGYDWTTSNTTSFKAYDDGTYYYVTLTADQIKAITNNKVTDNLYFALSSSNSLGNLYHKNDGTSWSATSTDTTTATVEKKFNNNLSYVLLKIQDSKITSVTLKYKYKNATDYIVTAETSTIKNPVEVIAKDATIRTDQDYNSTLHTYGDTYFYTEDLADNKTYYKSGTTTIPAKMSFTREDQKSVAAVSLDEVKKGTTLHIETQNVKEGYYVAGYVVNGETLALFNSNETPALDYTIPYDTEAKTKIEITPVYFAKDSSNCVTFYVEGFDSTVQNTWGNTIACYPYYSGTADTKNAFSCYPGQPMLYKDGKYFIQVPRTFNEKEVVGMTLNNYIWDGVHKTICNKSNAQTYDYDDFVRIADKQENGTYIVDNIIFSFKFRTKYNNFGYKTGDSKVSPSTISYDEFSGVATGNGWENLTDHNGNLVNIFGTQLFKTTDPRYSEKSTIENNPTDNEHLLIVSNGYDENYQGFYATEWTIYAYKDSAYTKVAQIPSSALVLSYNEINEAPQGTTIYNSQLKSYAEAYKALETYSNLPAYITYEQNDEQSDSNDGNGGNKGYRCDGRWYYSRINDEIISNVKIQYADDLSGTFTDDSFVKDDNVGTTTHAKAYFTNLNFYGKTTCEGKIGNGNFDITTTYSGSDYMFVGWYLEKEGVTTKITNSTNASIEMTGSETYVARYVKIPTGSINISHSLFSNVSDTAAKGAGTLGLQVTLSYNDGTNVFSKPYTYSTSDSSVSTNVLLSDVQAFYAMVNDKVNSPKLSDFSLKVSLSNSPAQHTTLNDVYLDNYSTVVANDYLSFKNDTASIQALNWTVPSTLTTTNEAVITFDKLFNDGTSFENPVSTSIKFFSEFKTDRVNYEITYNFTTRLYGEKQYKSKGTVSVGTVGLSSANGTYKFTNAYIMSVAPDESNFMKTFNWEEASITQSYDSETHTIKVTVKSKQVDRTVRATIHLPDGLEAKDIPTTYGGHFKEKGEFVMAPPKNNVGQYFSYWEIRTTKNNDFVAKCYSQYFNYVGYDDYIVTAVYGKGINTEIYDDLNTSTTVTFLEYSRNHWNDFDSAHHKHPADAPYYKENTEYDRLYADFALAFNYDGILLNATEVDGLKLGYVLDVTGNSTVEDLKNNILVNSDKPSFKIDRNNVLNYSIKRTDLDNKNRVECYYGIKNTDTNRSYNINVYSYMIVNGEVILSEQPITICYNGAINEQGGNNQ